VKFCLKFFYQFYFVTYCCIKFTKLIVIENLINLCFQLVNINRGELAVHEKSIYCVNLQWQLRLDGWSVQKILGNCNLKSGSETQSIELHFVKNLIQTLLRKPIHDRN
jgi:hypothetical protein